MEYAIPALTSLVSPVAAEAKAFAAGLAVGLVGAGRWGRRSTGAEAGWLVEKIGPKKHIAAPITQVGIAGPKKPKAKDCIQ